VLEVGSDADFVLLREEDLKPSATFVGGQLAWAAASHAHLRGGNL
jgi:hypothetical protein